MIVFIFIVGLIICCGLGIWTAYYWDNPYCWDCTWDSIYGRELESLFELVQKIFCAIVSNAVRLFDLLTDRQFIKCFSLFLVIMVFGFLRNYPPTVENLELLIPAFISFGFAVVKAGLLAFICGYLAMASAKFYKLVS